MITKKHLPAYRINHDIQGEIVYTTAQQPYSNWARPYKSPKFQISSPSKPCISKRRNDARRTHRLDEVKLEI